MYICKTLHSITREYTLFSSREHDHVLDYKASKKKKENKKVRMEGKRRGEKKEVNKEHPLITLILLIIKMISSNLICLETLKSHNSNHPWVKEKFFTKI